MPPKQEARVVEARTSKINNFTDYDNSIFVAARRANLDNGPLAGVSQRLARRIAVNALRGAVKAVCLLGDLPDIRESAYLVAGVLARVNAKGGGA